MFNFFKSKQNESSSKASITYFIDDDNVPMVDIVLKDYEKETISSLCSLLDILSNDAAYVNTIQMIQENLSKNNENEALIAILTHLSTQKSNKIRSYLDDTQESEVCIMPSDVMT